MTTKSWTKLTEIVNSLAEKHISKKDHRQAFLDEWTSQKSQVLKLSSQAVKKPKDPLAPRRGKTSYIFFCTANRADVKSKNPSLSATEITSKLGKMWKQLSAKAKQKYVDMASEDKQRYEQEMENYTPPPELASQETGKKRRKKDPNAPKKPLSAYILFSNEQRKVVQKEMPELKGKEIASELGRRWKNMSDEDKAPYLEMQAEAKAAYEANKSALEGKTESKPAEKPAEKPKRGRKGTKTSQPDDDSSPPESSKVEETKGRGKKGAKTTKVAPAKASTKAAPKEKAKAPAKTAPKEKAPAKKAKSGGGNDGFESFASEKREEVESDHPEWTSRKVDTELKKQWKALSDEDRESYALSA